MTGDAEASIDLSELDAFVLRNGDKCWFSEMPSDIKPTLSAALASKDYSNPTIAKWLQSKGLDITDSQVRHHRSRRCKCR